MKKSFFFGLLLTSYAIQNICAEQVDLPTEASRYDQLVVAINNHDTKAVTTLLHRPPALWHEEHAKLLALAKKQAKNTDGKINWLRNIPADLWRIVIGSVMIGFATRAGKIGFKFAKVMGDHRTTRSIAAIASLAAAGGLGIAGGYYVMTGLQFHNAHQTTKDAQAIVKFIEQAPVLE